MIKRFYNNTAIPSGHTSNAMPIAASTGSGSSAIYTYWFSDPQGSPQTHTTHVPVSAGLPTAADTTYWDAGTADLAALSNGVLQLYNIAGGAVSVMSSTPSLGTPNVTPNGTVAAGVTFNCPDHSAAFGTSSAYPVVFLGDVVATGFGSCQLSQWFVNGGNPEGNITLGDDATSIVQITPPYPDPQTINGVTYPAQSLSFNNITLDAEGLIDISLMPNIVLTGSLSLGSIYDQGGFVLTPTGDALGNWITLAPPPGSTEGVTTANPKGTGAFGLTVGHVPALANVLPTDNLFGQAGTLAVATLATVEAAVTAAAPTTAQIAAAIAMPSAAAIADAVKAINVDSTGSGAVSAAKCLEVLLSRAVGNATYDPATAVNTLLGRDGTTPIASVTLTGSGNRQQSTIN